MMLHTINKSPFEKNSLDSCLRLAKEGSSILLIEDAVYAAMKGTAVEEQVERAAQRYQIYALDPDMKARGLEEANLINGVSVVNYEGFVDLVASHDKVQAWL